MRISDWSSDVCSSDLDHGAHGDEQPLDRAPRFVFGQAAEPAVAGEFGGGLDGGLDRLVSGLVIAGDVGEARGEPAAPPARLAFGAATPAADLDRFLPGPFRGALAVGGVPQLLASFEDPPLGGRD